jgi:hypothetical protein
MVAPLDPEKVIVMLQVAVGEILLLVVLTLYVLVPVVPADQTAPEAMVLIQQALHRWQQTAAQETPDQAAPAAP